MVGKSFNEFYAQWHIKQSGFFFHLYCINECFFVSYNFLFIFFNSFFLILYYFNLYHILFICIILHLNWIISICICNIFHFYSKICITVVFQISIVFIVWIFIWIVESFYLIFFLRDYLFWCVRKDLIGSILFLQVLKLGNAQDVFGGLQEVLGFFFLRKMLLLV